MPIVVKAKKDESADSMIRKFKKKVLNEDILTEVRKREFHVTPSMVKKERKNEVRRKKYVEKLHRAAANKKK